MDSFLSILQPVAVLVGLLIAVVGGSAYLIGTFRKGRFQAANEAAEIWRAEYEAMKQRTGRLETDLATEREKTARLEGQLNALQDQATELRKLVMLEHVPAALDAALTGVASRIVQRVGEAEDRISEGVLTMSDAITKSFSQLHEQQMQWAKDLMNARPPGDPDRRARSHPHP